MIAGLFFFAKNTFSRTKSFFLDFQSYKKYNPKNIKIFKKVALNMTMGRPKLEIARTERLGLRLTKFELEKIIRVANKKNLSKTDAILKGIDLLERDKPKRYKSFAKNPGKNEPGIVYENSDDD